MLLFGRTFGPATTLDILSRLWVMTMPYTLNDRTFAVSAVLPDGKGGYVPCPELMTEEELVQFLRIPEVSKAGSHKNVIDNLKRMRDLPCIHISKQPLYPLAAVRK